MQGHGTANDEPDVSTSSDGSALDMGRLEELAIRLAESHVITHHPRRRPALLSRLTERESLLRDAYHHFVEMAEARRALPYAAEWLLDNFYVIQQALRQVREDMPAQYYRQLPTLDASPLEGYPRVYALAREVIGYCEIHLDLDRVTRFVHAYQQVTPLTTGELWALPTMLRLGVLECLARVIARVAGLQTRDGADDEACAGDSVLVPVTRDLGDDDVVANGILSLRALATWDWKAFFESVSRVEMMLRRDPAGVYPRMDFDTRDRYRGAVEELAHVTDGDEVAVAREAIKLAASEFAGREQPRPVNADQNPYTAGSTQCSSRTTHVGFYLLDAGRAQLETCLDYRPPVGPRLRRWVLGHLPSWLAGHLSS